MAHASRTLPLEACKLSYLPPPSLPFPEGWPNSLPVHIRPSFHLCLHRSASDALGLLPPACIFRIIPQSLIDRPSASLRNSKFPPMAPPLSPERTACVSAEMEGRGRGRRRATGKKIRGDDDYHQLMF